MQKKIIINWKY